MGQLHLNAEGEIVNANGFLIEPTITIPANTNNITISQNGIVSASILGVVQPQELGQITLTDFVNPAGLQSLGGNLFVATAASGDPQSGIAGENGLGSLIQGSFRKF